MRSGQITVTTAGTAVQGTSVRGRVFAIQALPTNTGYIYVGTDSTNLDVSSSTGYYLGAGASISFVADDLSEIWIDSSVNGEKVCWMRLE